MEKYRLKRALTTLGHTGLSIKTVNGKMLQENKLPALSMQSYAFTERKLRKKKKQVLSTLREAESLMAIELGRTPSRKKRRVFWEWKK